MILQDYRKPTLNEVKLLHFLIDNSKHNLIGQLDDCLVRTMDDGKMGSLLLYPKPITDKMRTFGSAIAEYQFTDSDGVEVLIALNVDNEGYLFELDVWKTDYSPLIKLPDNFHRTNQNYNAPS